MFGLCVFPERPLLVSGVSFPAAVLAWGLLFSEAAGWGWLRQSCRQTLFRFVTCCPHPSRKPLRPNLGNMGCFFDGFFMFRQVQVVQVLLADPSIACILDNKCTRTWSCPAGSIIFRAWQAPRIHFSNVR